MKRPKLSYRGDLVPVSFKDVAFVLGDGATKYGDRSWEHGISFDSKSNLLSIVSHAMERRNGVFEDRDSGLNPLLHVACRALMQYHLDLQQGYSSKTWMEANRPKVTRKLVYIASPFSCNTSNKSMKKRVEEHRYEMITYIAAELKMKYGSTHSFILPITQSYNLCKAEPKLQGSFEQWKEDDLLYISKCDEMWVVQMDGWNKSIGVKAEIDHAQSLGLPVKYIKVG